MRSTPPRRALAALVAAGALVVLARVWGLQLVADGAELKLAAVPWFGHWETTTRLTEALWPALFALAVVAGGPALAKRLRFGWLLVSTVLCSGAWAVLLYLTDRPVGRIGEPLEGRFEYLAALPRVDDPGAFVRTFVDELASYPIHVQGHPPGMVLLLWLLDRLGLGGSGPAAVVVLTVGAAASAAVLLTARELLSEDAARRAAPYLVLVPAAVWVATTADALFMGVGAWAIALTVLGTRDGTARSVALAAAGGALFAAGLHLSYGLAPLAAIPAWAMLSRRSWRAAGAGILGGGVVVAAFTSAGFFLLDGLRATAERYEAGVASDRPYAYFLVANLAVFAVSVGPAGVAALASTRWRRPSGLVWAAAGAVLAAHLSGLSKGEVERIWLPYVPWVLLATATTALPSQLSMAGRRVDLERVLLGLQATTALALAVFLRSPW